MNVIKVNVNFKNRTIYKQGVDLTSGDYNSTKLVFEFDRQDGRKIFEMKDPDGEIVLWSEIENNEIALVGKDEEGNNTTLFKEAGKYIFEISLYDGDSKLTSAFDYIPVKEEQVKDGNKIVTAYLPIFDQLLNEVDKVLEETTTKSTYAQEQGNYAKEQGNYAKEQGKKIENVVVDLEKIRNVAEQANSKSDTAISISKGANQALSYDDYQAMITNFNAFESERFNLGQQVMIRTLNVPDLWVYNYASEKIDYNYVDDTTFVNTLREQGYVQVGWYLLAELETQKVDLTEYIKNDDWATGSTGGIVKVSEAYGLLMRANNVLAVAPASQTLIDAKENAFRPITPSVLEYAVKSVVGGHETLTQTEYAELVANGTYTKEDGTVLTYSDNDYYNIVEE